MRAQRMWVSIFLLIMVGILGVVSCASALAIDGGAAQSGGAVLLSNSGQPADTAQPTQTAQPERQEIVSQRYLPLVAMLSCGIVIAASRRKGRGRRK